jgi:two-component system, chemotaxis family, response regulator PixG
VNATIPPQVEQREQNDRSFRDTIAQLKDIKLRSFSGNLIIQVESAPSWMLSFSLGRLGWISGGIEPMDRWQRNLAIACLDLPLDRLVKTNSHEEIFLNSNTLAQEWAAVEVLFDIIQISQGGGYPISYQKIQIEHNNVRSNSSLPLLDIEPILTRAIRYWQEWMNAGLANYFPSRFPIVRTSNHLYQLVSADNIKQEILLSIDGNRSLRNLAIHHRRHLLDFTKYLLPLLKSEAISLSIQPKSKLVNSEDGNGDSLLSGILPDRNISKSRPLIACIDDSILIYQNLEKILNKHDYRSYGVQDPLKIIPTLIKNKPNLIFLDLLMPISNGYEVCEQIRKTPRLKDIPVIILTGKDGWVDRMRAKIVGANGFLTKPVSSQVLLKILEKYTSTLSTKDAADALITTIQ